MDKNATKKKAMELFQLGHSYGEIAKELGEAKSTVHRWINDPNIENDTDGTLGTPIGTGLEQSETDFHVNRTEYPANVPIGTATIARRDDINDIKADLTKVELRKVELEHEYRMAQLKFQEQQYCDKMKLQSESKETERLRNEMDEIVQEIDILHQMHIENQNREVEIPQEQKELPKEYFIRLAKLLNEYLTFEDEPCSIEQIESIEAELDELMLEIDKWSKNNSVDLSHSDGFKLLKRFIKDVDQSLSCFYDEDETELILEFDKKWKRKVNGWLETI